MADRDHNPQTEDGYTRIANEWMEAFISYKAPSSLKDFVWAIARETWGWNEKTRAIPAERLASILNCTQGWVRQVRELAARHNLIILDLGQGRNFARYGIQKHYLDWVQYNSLRRPYKEQPNPNDPQARDVGSTQARADVDPQARAVALKDIKDTSKDKRRSAPTGAAPKEKVLTAIQQVIEEAWTACGFDGKPGSKGYGGLVKEVQRHDVPLARAWAAWLRSNQPQLTESADRQEWFCAQFHIAMNRPWEWDGSKNGKKEPELTQASQQSIRWKANPEGLL